MPGSPFQKRKYREIAVGIGGYIHVEVVAEEIAFPMGVPSPVAVRLRIMAFAAAGRTAFFLAIADPFFPLLCSSPDRSAVTGKSQMVRIDQSFLNRTIQELLPIKFLCVTLPHMSIPSRIVTGDGTPIGNVISSATTSTCMWPPIPTAISLYFRFWNGLHGMICFLFYTLFSP